MDSLIREKNGKEEIWYSEEYLKNQIEAAYEAGMFKGMKVDFHALQPMNGEMVDDLVIEFKKKLEDEYKKSIANSEVWRIS